MKSVTSIHYNNGAITTYTANEYTDIIRTMLDGRQSMWISWSACNDIIALSHQEAKILGCSETVEFLELDKGLLISSYFLDSLLIIKPSHSEGYELRVITKQDEPKLYEVMAKLNEGD